MMEQHKAAPFWNKMARRYAAAPIRDMAGYERTLARVGELVTGPGHLLEIGCGTGTTALRLAPLCDRLTATDVSPDMIAIAQEKQALEGIRNLEFRVEPADFAGEEESYDAILAFNLIHLVPDRAQLWRRIRRALRPGGILITKTPCIGEMNPLIRLAIPVAQWLGKAPEVSVFRGVDLESEITEAGFAVIERDRHGSGRRDPRIFLVARKSGAMA